VIAAAHEYRLDSPGAQGFGDDLQRVDHDDALVLTRVAPPFEAAEPSDVLVGRDEFDHNLDLGP
jgi:hypothetical protein